MAETKPPSQFFTKLTSFLFLVLLHLACFVFSEKRRRNDHEEDSPETAKKRSKGSILISPITPVISFLKVIFSVGKSKSMGQTHPSTPPRSSQHSAVAEDQPESPSENSTIRKRRPSMSDSEIIDFFPLRNDIFPCTACGEIFQKPLALEAHQASRHAVSELLEGDSGNNIVRIIFNTGWAEGDKSTSTLEIHRILKIHNSQKILSRFEEHREAVKSRCGAGAGGGRRRDERCAADGNEVLRFHCATFVCELGRHGGSGICAHQYCGVCGIIRSGFSAKLDGVSTMSTSRRAHEAVPEDTEEEFAFMNVKRAMLVCRVVAGRVGCEGEDEDGTGADKNTGGFDSVIGSAGEELLVFNPRALLPCFVIVYTV